MATIREAAHPVDPETDTERRLLEAAVPEARADRRAAVPHEQVRQQMLLEIERLKRKAAVGGRLCMSNGSGSLSMTGMRSSHSLSR